MENNTKDIITTLKELDSAVAVAEVAEEVAHKANAALARALDVVNMRQKQLDNELLIKRGAAQFNTLWFNQRRQGNRSVASVETRV